MHRSERSLSVRWAIVGGLAGIVLLLCAGCPSNTSVNSVLHQILANMQEGSGTQSIRIRIVNGSEGLTEELDLRIDGTIQTFSCDAEDMTCNFNLGILPVTVEAVEERRLDADGLYRGGRIFSGQAGFTFTRDQFENGSTIVFQLSEDQAEAFVL